MSHTNLASQVDQAFAAGDNAKGLELLRVLAESDSENPSVFHRLAVIEEQIGQPDAATTAHLRCLELGKDNPLAYLYAGFWLEKTNQLANALPLYSLGLDIIERSVSPQQIAQQPAQTQLRYQAAVKAVRSHLLTLHEEAAGQDPRCQRIQNARWVQTDTRDAQPLLRQRPHLFYIPHLSADIDAANCEWLTALEKQHALIIEEFTAALPQITSDGRPYLSGEPSVNAAFGSLAGSLNWTALDLFKDGVEQQATTSLFPKTRSLLFNAPLYTLVDTPYEVFFSILKAGQRINPHYGLSNHSLTVHLPIDVPNDCQLIVDGEMHRWQRGKALVFDDTLLHEARNDSSQDRIVLIFSIWNPNLSKEECAAIKRTFNARANWLHNRADAMADTIARSGNT